MQQANLFYSIEKKERALSSFLKLADVKKFLHIDENNINEDTLIDIFINMAMEYAENFLNISIIDNCIAIRYEMQINNAYKLFYGPYFKNIKISIINIEKKNEETDEMTNFHFIKPDILEINTNNIDKYSLIEINYTGHIINKYTNDNIYYPVYFNILRSTILNHIAYLYNNINNYQPNVPDSITKTYNALRKIYD